MIGYIILISIFVGAFGILFFIHKKFPDAFGERNTAIGFDNEDEIYHDSTWSHIPGNVYHNNNTNK